MSVGANVTVDIDSSVSTNLSKAAVQIWEQEIAWAEADKPVKLAARALTFPQSDSSLHQQPIFCFITMMKMWYWSGLVYDYKRVNPFAGLAVDCIACSTVVLAIDPACILSA